MTRGFISRKTDFCGHYVAGIAYAELGKYTPNAPVNIDFNLRYQLVDHFWIGTGVSTAGNYHLEAGYILGENMGWYSHLRIGYGFDYSFTTFGPAAGPAHEINLFYTFGD